MKNYVKSSLIISGLIAMSLISMPSKAMEHHLKRSKSALKVTTNTQNGTSVSKQEFNEALKKAAKAVDADGNTALHYAAMDGNSDLAQQLVDAGANPLHQNNQGETALHKAVIAPSCEVAQIRINGVSQKEQRKRILTILCVFKKLYTLKCISQIPKDARYLILSYLPTLIIGSQKLCKQIVPKYTTQAELQKRYSKQQENLFALKLLELKDDNGKTAYNIARENRCAMMARMTKIANKEKQSSNKTKRTLTFVDTTNKENKVN